MIIKLQLTVPQRLNIVAWIEERLNHYWGLAHAQRIYKSGKEQYDGTYQGMFDPDRLEYVISALGDYWRMREIHTFRSKYIRHEPPVDIKVFSREFYRLLNSISESNEQRGEYPSEIYDLSSFEFIGSVLAVGFSFGALGFIASLVFELMLPGLGVFLGLLFFSIAAFFSIGIALIGFSLFCYYRLTHHFSTLPSDLVKAIDAGIDLKEIESVINEKLHMGEASEQTIVDLSLRLLGDTGAKLLVGKLMSEEYPATEKNAISLLFNNIGIEGARDLADAVKSGKLSTLYLSFNDIGDEGAKILLEAVTSNRGLDRTNVYFANNGLTNALLTDSSVNLPSKSRDIDLSGNHFDDEGAIALAKKLPPTLEFLSLAGNEIGNQGVTALAKRLPSTLQALDLARNEIRGLGVANLAEVISNSKLRLLNLSGNNIDNLGVGVLTRNLPSNLESLDLSNNAKLSVDSAESLARALLPNTSIVSLKLDYLDNDSTRETKLSKLIRFYLERNKLIQRDPNNPRWVNAIKRECMRHGLYPSINPGESTLPSEAPSLFAEGVFTAARNPGKVTNSNVRSELQELIKKVETVTGMMPGQSPIAATLM